MEDDRADIADDWDRVLSRLVDTERERDALVVERDQLREALSRALGQFWTSEEEAGEDRAMASGAGWVLAEQVKATLHEFDGLDISPPPTEEER